MMDLLKLVWEPCGSTVILAPSSVLTRINCELRKLNKKEIADYWIIFPTSPKSAKLKFDIKVRKIFQTSTQRLTSLASGVSLAQMPPFGCKVDAHTTLGHARVIIGPCPVWDSHLLGTNSRFACSLVSNSSLVCSLEFSATLVLMQMSIWSTFLWC